MIQLTHAQSASVGESVHLIALETQCLAEQAMWSISKAAVSSNT